MGEKKIDVLKTKNYSNNNCAMRESKTTQHAQAKEWRIGANTNHLKYSNEIFTNAHISIFVR